MGLYLPTVVVSDSVQNSDIVGAMVVRGNRKWEQCNRIIILYQHLYIVLYCKAGRCNMWLLIGEVTL
jgi:hypothetical protein